MRIDFSGPRIQNSDPDDPGTGIFDLRLDWKFSEMIKLHKIRDFLLLGYSGEFETLVSWNGTFWKISNFDLSWKWGYQTPSISDFLSSDWGNWLSISLFSFSSSSRLKTEHFFRSDLIQSTFLWIFSANSICSPQIAVKSGKILFGNFFLYIARKFASYVVREWASRSLTTIWNSYVFQRLYQTPC